MICRINNKCIHFISQYFEYLITFSSQVLFWGLGYLVLTRSMLYLINNLHSFATREIDTKNIQCSYNMRFWAIFRMGTISAVPNMHVRATLHKYRALGYLIWFLEGNSVNSCVLRAYFSPMKCSETIFYPRASLPDTI